MHILESFCAIVFKASALWSNDMPFVGEKTSNNIWGVRWSRGFVEMTSWLHGPMLSPGRRELLSTFPEGGDNPDEGGTNLLFGGSFAENCTKMREIGPGRVPSAPGSVTGFTATLVHSLHLKWLQFPSLDPKHHHSDLVPGPGFTLAASPCTNGSRGDKPRAYINYFMHIHSFSFKAVCTL